MWSTILSVTLLAVFFACCSGQSGVRTALSGQDECRETYSPQFTTMCACANASDCGPGAQIWFSCQNDGDSLLSNVGLQFSEATGCGSSGISFQVTNFADWCDGHFYGVPDQYSPIVVTGEGRGATGPMTADYWKTGGVVTLGNGSGFHSLPLGRGMMACTANGLLSSELNNHMGPIAPKCIRDAWGTPADHDDPQHTHSAPSTVLCPVLSLFDGVGPTRYVGWGIVGVKVQMTDAWDPTCWHLNMGDPPDVVRDLPTPPQTWSPRYAGASGWNFAYQPNMRIRCTASLHNPCEQLCPAHPGWLHLGQPLPGQRAAGSDADGCCPAESVFYHHLPSGKINSSVPVECCLNGTRTGLPPNEACCPTERVLPGTPPTCCPVGQGNVGGVCCASSDLSTCCNAAGLATVPDASPPMCCPAERTLRSASGLPVACCSRLQPLPVADSPRLLEQQWHPLASGVCCNRAFLSNDNSTCCATSNATFPAIAITSGLLDKCCPVEQLNHPAPGLTTEPYEPTCCPPASEWAGRNQVSADHLEVNTSMMQRLCCPDSHLVSLGAGIVACCPSSQWPYANASDTVVSGGVVTTGHRARKACCTGEGDMIATLESLCCPAASVVRSREGTWHCIGAAYSDRDQLFVIITAVGCLGLLVLVALGVVWYCKYRTPKATYHLAGMVELDQQAGLELVAPPQQADA